MAVIDISIDLPKNCYECNRKCNHHLWVSETTDCTNSRHKDCPFKSIDHLKDEINWLHKIGNPEDGKVYVPINDVLDVIDKICNREKETHG